MIPESVMDFMFWFSMAGISCSIWLFAVCVILAGIAISELWTKKHLEKQR